MHYKQFNLCTSYKLSSVAIAYSFKRVTNALSRSGPIQCQVRFLRSWTTNPVEEILLQRHAELYHYPKFRIHTYLFYQLRNHHNQVLSDIVRVQLLSVVFPLSLYVKKAVIDAKYVSSRASHMIRQPTASAPSLPLQLE